MTNNSYKPPYTITPVIITLIEQIGEAIGRLSIVSDQTDLRLRPIKRYRLDTILAKVKSCDQLTPQVSPQDTPQVKQLLKILTSAMSVLEILEALELRDRKSMTQRYLRPTLEAGLIEMTVPDKPNSRNQKYQVTDMGKVFMVRDGKDE